MESVEIRPAEEADKFPVFELAREFATSFEVQKSSFQSSFASVLYAPDAALLIAEYQGQAVGYCLAFDHPAFFANGRVTWVEEIMVAEGLRLKGVGSQLMSAIEAWALDRGSKIVALATRRASSFYAAVGYEESATYFRKVLQ